MWDIFCAVVDNYGDIGICWRLAQQLKHDHAITLRLWIDAPDVFAHLCPEYQPHHAVQMIEGVEVCLWSADFPPVPLPEVVITTFSCSLPAPYLAEMIARSSPPLWVNIEYLSAEPWVDSSHLMRSPLPRAPHCVQTFFFPGFSPQTGGVFKEKGLIEKRRAFQSLLKPSPSNTLHVSLFAYAHAPYAALLTLCEQAALRIEWKITAGKATEAVQALLKNHAFEHQTFQFLPFLSQAQYDELLWSCDVNFVRGEDSFVRAQWAGRPFIWHIYPQEGDVHLEKLDAFLMRYTEDPLLTPTFKAHLKRFSTAWNTGNLREMEKTIPTIFSQLKIGTDHAERWVTTLEALGDVASHLVEWVNQTKRTSNV